jgi:hypothetical protein
LQKICEDISNGYVNEKNIGLYVTDTLLLLTEGMCIYVIEFGADPNDRIV